jgi:uncharacterized metal-binding protein
MPAGQTHDRITVWSLPIMGGITLGVTQSSHLTLWAAAGFLFGGLMFGPDLDIYSRQYQRWGWFRWIWLPYRKMMRHRSLLSHGPLIGTSFRVFYLAGWIGLAATIGFALAYGWQHWQGHAVAPIATLWGDFNNQSTRWFQQHQASAIALAIGLEAGAISHSISDWIGSAYKRFRHSKS